MNWKPSSHLWDNRLTNVCYHGLMRSMSFPHPVTPDKHRVSVTCVGISSLSRTEVLYCRMEHTSLFLVMFVHVCISGLLKCNLFIYILWVDCKILLEPTSTLLYVPSIFHQSFRILKPLSGDFLCQDFSIWLFSHFKNHVLLSIQVYKIMCFSMTHSYNG